MLVHYLTHCAAPRILLMPIDTPTSSFTLVEGEYFTLRLEIRKVYWFGLQWWRVILRIGESDIVVHHEEPNWL